MRQTISRSKTPPKHVLKQFQTFELNNAIYQGDTLHFKRDGFGTILSDDGTYFTGIFHRDQMEGPGALFFLDGMLYSEFRKGHLQGPSILKYGDFIWCGYLQNSKPLQNSYLYNRTSQTWNIVQNPQIFIHLQWPDLPNFIDSKFQGLIKSVLSFDFEFLKIKSPAHDNFGILWPPPLVKLIHENQRKDSINEVLQPVLDKNLSNDLVYLGYLSINHQIHLTPENLIPHGIGVFINHTTMKINLSGNFDKGWLDGLGRQNLLMGDVIEGNYKKSSLNGLGLQYSSVSDSYVYGIFDKNKLKEKKMEGTGYPKQIVTQMANKIHQSSIQYMNQTICWKKLIGVDLGCICKELTQYKNHNLSNKENNFWSPFEDHQFLNKLKPGSVEENKIRASQSINKDPQLQQISKQNSSVLQYIQSHKTLNNVQSLNKFKHPENLQKYYQECLPEEYVIHSVNNRMNNYDEFHQTVAQSTTKVLRQEMQFTQYSTSNDYEGILTLVEKMTPQKVQSFKINNPPSLQYLNSIYDLKSQENSFNVSYLFKDKSIESPQFNNSQIKSVMDQSRQFRGQTRQSQDYQKYDNNWQNDQWSNEKYLQLSSARPFQKKRIFDQNQSFSITKRPQLSVSQTRKKIFE